MTEWETIDTAPKDGTLILLCNIKELDSIFLARFLSGTQTQYVWYSSEDVACYHTKSFTHWISIPDEIWKWQDIESAPKDGRSILAYTVKNGENSIVLIDFDESASSNPWSSPEGTSTYPTYWFILWHPLPDQPEPKDV